MSQVEIITMLDNVSYPTSSDWVEFPEAKIITFDINAPYGLVDVEITACNSITDNGGIVLDRLFKVTRFGFTQKNIWKYYNVKITSISGLNSKVSVFAGWSKNL